MRNLFCLFFLTGIFFNLNVSAQPELDTSFNATGKLVINGFLASANDVAVQPDNKIIIGGGCATINGQQPICVGRLNEDGSRDTTFGNSSAPGFALTSIPGNHSTNGWATNSVALQNDGKIVAAGYSGFQGSSNIWLILARYNSNGTLDNSFGTNGTVRTIYTGNTYGQKVLILPDGKILVAGYFGTSSNYQLIAVRYNADGTLDQTFDEDGFFLVDLPGRRTSGLSAALQVDGKILIGGTAWTLPNDPVPTAASLLIRLNPDGTLDPTFDEDGIRMIVFGTSASHFSGFFSLAVQSDGRILALDNARKLYRFNTDGSLDAEFNNGGWREILTSDTIINDMSVTPGGKITVVGERTYCSCPGPYQYRIARFLRDGATDMTFSGDGFLEFNAGLNVSVANAVAYDSKGKTVIAGFSATGTVLSPYENGTWSLARLIASPAQNVAFSGRVIKPGGKPVINAFVTLKSGSEIIANGRTNPFGYFHFKNIQSGQTYTLTTTAKNLNFTDRSVLVDDEIVNFLIAGTPQ